MGRLKRNKTILLLTVFEAMGMTDGDWSGQFLNNQFSGRIRAEAPSVFEVFGYPNWDSHGNSIAIPC